MTVSFEKFPVYIKAIDFSIEVFRLFDSQEMKNEFALVDQLKRATISISSNIAEGSEYGNNKQFIRFLWIAKGSCAEVRSMLFLMMNLKKIQFETFEKLNAGCEEISTEIYHFIKYLEKNSLSKK